MNLRKAAAWAVLGLVGPLLVGGPDEDMIRSWCRGAARLTVAGGVMWALEEVSTP